MSIRFVVFVFSWKSRFGSRAKTSALTRRRPFLDCAVPHAAPPRPGTTPSRLLRFAPAAAVAATFALSRLAYAAAGVRFDATPIDWFWQYLDPAALRGRFFESILNLHSQPPAMNFFLGAVLNLAPGREAAVFTAFSLVTGLVLALAVYLLMAELGVRPWLAAVLAALFTASPACVLYENWLFYTYPVTACVVGAALCWARYLRTSRARDAVGLFALSGLAALTWSLFHLLWLFVPLGLLLWARPALRRRTLLAAAVPVLLVAGWYAKNLALFGQFTASTWGGMNFSKMTNAMLFPEERNSLCRQGVITDVSLQPPFSSLDKYPAIADSARRTGIPVLDARAKTSGAANYNNLAYIEVARRAGADAGRVLRARPVSYLRGLAAAWLAFFQPADVYLLLAPNRGHIEALADGVNTVLGRFARRPDSALRRSDPVRYYARGLFSTLLLVLIAYLLVIIGGPAVLLFRRRLGRHFGPGLLLIWATVCYVAVVGNGIEVGENNRFRFTLDPLVLAALGVAVEQLLRRLASHKPERVRPRDR